MPAGAHDRRGQVRLAVVTQRVNVEAVIAARYHDVVAEGDVGIGKAQQGRAGIRCFVGFCLIVFGGVVLCSCHSLRDHVIGGVSAFLAMLMNGGLLLLGDCFICCCLDRRWQKAFGGQLSGVDGVIEPQGLGEHCHLSEIPDGFFGIVKTGCETGSRVI